MKAMVVRQHGGSEVMEFVPDFPDPTIGEGDVLIRVRASSLNYHDVFTRRGMPRSNSDAARLRSTLPVRSLRSVGASKAGRSATECWSIRSIASRVG
jgi:NADPH:quinone reductase-like Zn-dependent oxidoreductase